MSDRVWADSFCRQRRNFELSLQRVALDQAVNAETCDRKTAAIEKDMLVGWTIGDQSGEFSNGHWPERTETFFSAFAADLHARRGQVQMVDQQVGGFISTAAGVVKGITEGHSRGGLGQFDDWARTAVHPSLAFPDTEQQAWSPS